MPNKAQHCARMELLTKLKYPNPFAKGMSASFLLFFLLALATCGLIAYKSALDYQEKNAELASQSDLEATIWNVTDDIVDRLAGPLYDGYKDRLARLDRLKSNIGDCRRRALLATVAYFLVSVVFLSSAYFLPPRPSIFYLSLLITSTVSLAVGLFAPILMVTTYTNLLGLPTLVFTFSSRSIVSTIVALFSTGNLLVASSLLLFSVLLPITKTCTMGLALCFPQQPVSNKALAMMEAVGKWSMADVFVVALLLTYFSLNRDEHSNAEVQIGLFFFMTYVLLSLALASSIHAYNRLSLLNLAQAKISNDLQ